MDPKRNKKKIPIGEGVICSRVTGVPQGRGTGLSEAEGDDTVRTVAEPFEAGSVCVTAGHRTRGESV